MSRRNVRRTMRVAAVLLGGLACLLLAYLVAGTIGAAIPTNAGWRAPERGVEIWIESNGIHTGIVVPKVAAAVDWRPLLRADHLADPRYAGHGFASFGWGEHAFYLETPTWGDVRPTTVLAAAAGSRRTLAHVDHVPRPRPDGGARRIVLRPEEYRRLAKYIRAGIVPGGARYPGYYGFDVFYTSRGRYSAIRTCNAWTGDALRYAGVRVGWWTPFPWSVMAWF